MMQQMLDRDPIAFLPLVIFGLSGFIVLVIGIREWPKHHTRRAVIVMAVCVLMLSSSLYGLFVGTGGIIAGFWGGLLLLFVTGIQLQIIFEKVGHTRFGAYLSGHPRLRRALIVVAMLTAVTAAGAWAISHDVFTPGAPRQITIIGIVATILISMWGIGLMLGFLWIPDAWHDWRAWGGIVAGATVCAAEVNAVIVGYSGRSMMFLAAAVFGMNSIYASLLLLRSTMKSTYWRPADLSTLVTSRVMSWNDEVIARRIGAITYLIFAILLTAGLFSCALSAIFNPQPPP